MEKLTRNIEKDIRDNKSFKNPSALGGLYTMALFPLSWLNDSTRWITRELKSFHANVDAPLANKERAVNGLKDSMFDAQKAIKSASKSLKSISDELAKADAKLAAMDIKSKKRRNLQTKIMDLETDYSNAMRRISMNQKLHSEYSRKILKAGGSLV